MGRWFASGPLAPVALENSAARRMRTADFARFALQLALVLIAIHALALEASLGLSWILPWIGVGYCVHVWLPPTWKLPCFLLVSAGAFTSVVGPAAAATVFALGALLFALCHLPTSLPVRVAALVAVGVALCTARAGYVEAPWSPLVLPLLASMFLFRCALYLYDEHTQPRAVPLSMRLSYFLLLPNVCFLLFPVVDYRTFQRTYYAQPAAEIHARGLRWMLRGVVHLLVYRFVHKFLTPEPEGVDDLLDLSLFLVSSYLLYLRVSGHFHLVVGILHLFGFALPETNHSYWLSSSFSDGWRRTNVYWTEFMKKLVYYPSFMRLRRHGTTFAIVAATLLVFAATWQLHALQWFWLQGEFPLAWDGLFWGGAGLLALVSVLVETRGGATAPLAAGPPSVAAAAWRVLRIAGVFATTSLLWSLWSSRSLSEWLAVLLRAGDFRAREWLWLVAVVALAVAVGTLWQCWRPLVGLAARRERWLTSPWAHGGACALLACLAWAPAPDSLGTFASLVHARVLRGATVNFGEQTASTAYYDRLIRNDGRVDWAWKGARFDPDDAPGFMTSALLQPIPTGGIFELMPSRRLRLAGEDYTSNADGMRDREYPHRKPPQTWRIALLGTCVEMGIGVGDEAVVDVLLEKHLNRDVSPRTGLTYEVLNFAVPAYTILHQMFLVRDKVAAYEPDVVLVSNHVGSTVKYLIEAARAQGNLAEEALQVLDIAGVKPGMDENEVRQKTRAILEDIELWTLRRLGRECTQVGAIPVWMDVPMFIIDEAPPEGLLARIESVRTSAQEAGFRTIDLSSGVVDLPMQDLVHPLFEHVANAAGHRVLEARLYRALLAQPDLLGEH